MQIVKKINNNVAVGLDGNGRERNEQYSQNKELLESLKEKNPKQYECVRKIDEFLTEEFEISCSEEEQAYLLLHIVGLSTQEDRNQLGVTSEK